MRLWGNIRSKGNALGKLDSSSTTDTVGSTSDDNDTARLDDGMKLVGNLLIVWLVGTARAERRTVRGHVPAAVCEHHGLERRI